MKRLKLLFAGFALLVPLLAIGALPVLAAAETPQNAACVGAGGTFDPATSTCSGSNGGLDLNAAFKKVADTLIYVVGAISVLMVIIGGLRYVLSGGDSTGVKNAKDTILYALIGVGVALVSYAIVNFVVSRL
ncbi:MAG: hypothetical protein ACHQUB_01270 [Candidatus Saccharimonadia bacterium]